MADRRRGRSLLAVLVLVALVLVTVDYRQGEGGALAALQRGALTAFGPVQEGFAAVVRPVGVFFSGIGELSSLRDANSQLVADNQQLQEQLRSVTDLQQENAALAAQLGMGERLQLKTTGARVFAQSPGSFSYSRLIDIGADQGVRPNQAVINADGLVGRVTDVTASNARIQLVTTPSEGGYVVRIAETGETGRLSGRGAQPYQMVLGNIDAEVEEGAEVVTQAFEGTAIPDGIPVGVVESVPDAAGRFLTVRPYVDFGGLDIVQIVLNAPELPADLDPADQIPVAPGPRPDPPDPSADPTSGPTPGASASEDADTDPEDDAGT